MSRRPSSLLTSVPPWCPTLSEIEAAPELAALSILRASIQTAAFAIGAANPELADLDSYFPSIRDPTAEILRFATRILTDLDLLARSIDAYRLASAAFIPSAHRSDDDFPF